MAQREKKTTTEGIRRHDLHSMGIGPIGLDCSKVEDLIESIGSPVTLPHRHDYYEIIWFTKAQGSHMVEFVNHELSDNMLLVLPRNQIHCFQTTKGIQGYMLRFSELFLESIQIREASLIKNSLFKLHASPIRQLTEEKRPFFESLIKLLKSETSQTDQLNHREMLGHLLMVFLIEVERIQPAEESLGGIKQDLLERFYRFSSLLEENFRNKSSVGWYARQMGTSPKSLRNLCLQVSGLQVKTLIEQRLVLEAKLYLQNSNLQVQQITSQLGFEDASYFSRFFKRATGSSPSDFRALSVQ